MHEVSHAIDREEKEERRIHTREGEARRAWRQSERGRGGLQVDIIRQREGGREEGMTGHPFW